MGDKTILVTDLQGKRINYIDLYPSVGTFHRGKIEGEFKGCKSIHHDMIALCTGNILYIFPSQKKPIRCNNIPDGEICQSLTFCGNRLIEPFKNLIKVVCFELSILIPDSSWK